MEDANSWTRRSSHHRHNNDWIYENNLDVIPTTTNHPHFVRIEENGRYILRVSGGGVSRIHPRGMIGLSAAGNCLLTNGRHLSFSQEANGFNYGNLAAKRRTQMPEDYRSYCESIPKACRNFC
ncbi:hypothetical protein TNCT_641601 [Trichonephila clavata]|uniref:Uncharacterized protein n=1 Tax=Trichonephila clavata TaxID=2740835 RepID=A0A8X6L2X1_TRICU|nr:hypothetical protein TNCT_641601 [Trichonephila clavata]